jgi:hypothetical protein
LYQASALPGWTRAHVLTHLAQAADSRTGLLRAARAGRVGQQYPSEQARADAIDVGARRPPAAIRADLHRAVQDGLTAIREHPRHLRDAPGIWLPPSRFRALRSEELAALARDPPMWRQSLTDSLIGGATPEWDFM